MADAPTRRGLPLGRLALLGVVWGVTFPVSRLGVSGGSDPFLLVAIDFAVAAAVCAPIAAGLRRPFPSGRSIAESAAVGALLIAGINLPLFWGERFATGGVASIVYAASPLVSVGFVTVLRNGERIGRSGVAALTLGLAGVVLLAVAAGGAAVTNVAGLAAFALGTVCQGGGAVLLVRLRPAGEGAWGQSFQFVGGGAASLAAVALLAPHASIVWSPGVVGSIAYVGIISLAGGYALFFDLLRTHGAVGANQVTFLNPVVALAVGVLAFGEPFAPAELGGLTLILLALVLLHRPGGETRAAPSTRARPAVARAPPP